MKRMPPPAWLRRRSSTESRARATGKVGVNDPERSPEGAQGACDITTVRQQPDLQCSGGMTPLEKRGAVLSCAS